MDPARFVEEAVPLLRKRITAPAIIALSGGVDSTVAAALTAKAAPNLLHAVYVDTGLMRKGETDGVQAMCSRAGINLHVVRASDRFFETLKGATDPEDKRKRIGHLFVRIFEEEARAVGAKFLVQGTIAPDWIESGDKLRDTIKTHHNVGGLPPDMQLEVVEPLRELYKDEVRATARHLGLEVAERQPFPGPGLAVRVLGELTPERVATVRECCAIVEEEIERAVAEGEMSRPWQYFAVLLPIRTVGVQGDIRAYGESVAVRAVESLDAMTAEASPIPFHVIHRISRRITNSLPHVNRVVYDVTDKPPATVEWE